jgi:Ca2+-binding RTX toxin-like protein
MVTIKENKPNCKLCISILSVVLLSTVIIFPIAAFAADLTGTDRDDTLYGTMADDIIEGKGGKDSLYGNGGTDKISGNSGDDLIQGDPGDDTLNGNDGNDIVLGGSGLDKINGGNGDDYLESSFVIGSTSISDGKSDTLICGSGIDTAFINPLDGDTAAADCEIVVSTP